MLWTLTNLCCVEQIANTIVHNNDTTLTDQLLLQFRSSKFAEIKFEALNTLISMIHHCSLDEKTQLRGICQEVMQSIYEELTEIEDNKKLQILILEALS